MIYLTDTPGDPPPFDAVLVAVGEPVENVGFTGVSFATEEGTLVWRALVRNNGTKPADPKKECNAPIEKLVSLGQSFQVTGTPTILFGDGTKVPGAIPLSEIEKRLAEIAKRS